LKKVVTKVTRASYVCMGYQRITKSVTKLWLKVVTM